MITTPDGVDIFVVKLPVQQLVVLLLTLKTEKIASLMNTSALSN